MASYSNNLKTINYNNNILFDNIMIYRVVLIYQRQTLYNEFVIPKPSVTVLFLFWYLYVRGEKSTELL